MTDIMPNWLEHRAYITPNRPAIEFEDHIYTFKELDALVKQTAAKLTSVGVGENDVCALLLRNHVDSVIIIHALFSLGAEIVMLNNKLTANELNWQIEDSNPAFLITEKSFEEKVNHIEAQQIWFKEEIENQDESDAVRLLHECHLDKTATIMYTSGTTGNPKGVIQTFGNHWWSAVGSVLNLGLKEDDCWYCAVPIFHISGLSILMRSVIYGMKVVLIEKFDEKEANRDIEAKGVTIVSVVTSMLHRMVEHLGSQRYPASFRSFLLGGGPAPKSLLEKCKEKKIPVFQSYGMTETASQIVTLSPEDSLQKIGSAGKPLMPSQLKIKKEGREAAPEEAGEIIVAGPNVTKGYLNRPEATEESIRNGWLYTGDIGYLDEEGFLYVLDRRSDLIISGGENVYPAEIESLLSKHPAIFEAGVIGRADEKWGEVPVAFVVTKKESSTLQEEELIQYCKEHLASYKIPKQIVFLKELPRNGTGKLVRKELKKRL